MTPVSFPGERGERQESSPVVMKVNDLKTLRKNCVQDAHRSWVEYATGPYATSNTQIYPGGPRVHAHEVDRQTTSDRQIRFEAPQNSFQ